ncbi:hypothetical protein K435DRAFT_698087 [Dendrothele bispora CBS 962.96]|uniref:UbiA prenyltransferase n=1 Tax=Dendrothele bispora (strain CBS 962.96) TaxID=1314807 RepID=A0A4S8KTW1_DENBC|nr:hypothetical protein K435DRAFT_698087 [Dendrothele bispora CBS 962.96]
MLRHYLLVLSYHAYSLLLFTKSNMKTTLIPVTILAASSAPLANLSRLPHVIFWIWIHLLQFDVSNQTMDPEEDRKNKTERPLPAGRISLRSAILLRWSLVPVCLGLSYCYSYAVLCSSIALVLITVIYNECGAHAGNFVVRNLGNALGFASFETGSTLVAGISPETLDKTAIWAVCISMGILATTIQAQDFRDEPGDRLIGRRTLPIVLPHIARETLMFLLFCWGIFLSMFWGLDTSLQVILIMFSLFVGGRYVTKKQVMEDQISYHWYNVGFAIFIH